MSSTRRDEFLPFHRPYLGEEEISEVVDTLRSGWLTLGPKTALFEERFAEFIGASHAIAVNSCTAALHLALEAAGVGPGDEVITSPYTFTATVAAIGYCGATPVLADTTPDYPNIDCAQVEASITAKTKAIVPVHFAGASCDLDRLRELADGCGAMIVEDAAHALPARWRGQRIGAISEATAFSFYAGKNMTAGEGGMVTTNDPALAERIRCIRLHGISKDAWKRYSAAGSWYYEVEHAGYKYNPTDISSAIGLHQLARLETFHTRRLQIVERYQKALKQIPGIITPVAPQGAESAWHLFVIRLDADQFSVTRDEVIEMLKADNIGTSVHFIPIHHHPHWQRTLGVTKGQYPNATALYEASISLPLFPTMTDEEVDGVVASLARIAGENRR
ncbi:MAG: dTDP-4-amino-4,6-dideoxygalactose transaminase [Hyphomicrobiaceae bacterium]|jgi:dTDP-4-amino-4,6-dideoxygalactose transaminase